MLKDGTFVYLSLVVARSTHLVSGSLCYHSLMMLLIGSRIQFWAVRWFLHLKTMFQPSVNNLRTTESTWFLVFTPYGSWCWCVCKLGGRNSCYEIISAQNLVTASSRARGWSVTEAENLEAPAVDDAGTGLIVLLLEDPHLLEGRQGSQDGTTNPDGVLTLRRSDDLDRVEGEKWVKYTVLTWLEF